MAKLNLEAVLSLIDKVSEPLKNITQSSDKVTSAFKKQQDEMKKLNQTMSNISSFKTMNENLRKTKDELQNAQAHLHRLSQEYQNAERPTKAMAKALEQARKAVKDLEQTQQAQQLKQQGIVKALKEAGVSTKHLIRDEKDLQKQISAGNTVLEQRKQKLERLKNAQDKYKQSQEKIARLQEQSGNLAMKAGIGAGLLTAPIISYANSEEAAMTLKVSMMDATGKVADEFTKINALADKLGTTLPGSGEEFNLMMAKLVQQGISFKDILGGVGEASGKLAVVMKMPFEQSAEFVAKMQDATKTKAEDMLQLMDVIQKSYYLGVDSTNMLSGFSKLADGMKTIRMEGLAGSKAMAPLLVMADQASMSGESAGNAFSKIFKSMMDTAKIQKALKGKGMQMNFTDGKGEFGGLDNMFKQLEKLKGLSTEARLPILSEMFGNDSETIQALNLLIDKGQAGYKETIAKMEQQASLQQRVDAQLGTLKNIWDSAKGAMGSVLGSLGETLAPQLKDLVKWIGNVADKVNTWIKANPVLAGTLMKIAVVMVAILGALSAGALALTALIGPLALLKVSLATLAGGGSIAIAILSKIGGAFTWLLGIVRTVAMFLMANPIGIAVGLIATAVYLIYRNWGQIAPFFARLWSSIKAGAMSLWQMLKSGFASAIQAILAILSAFNPVSAFMRAFSAVKSYLAGLGAEFASYGRNLMQGLANGITQSASQALSKALSVANSIKSTVKSAFGINSPSKVFHQYGVWNMQGLAQGIDKMAHLPQNSVMDASQNMLTAMDSRHIKWQHGSALQPKMSNAGASTPTVQTFNIYASDGMNEQELARLVAMEVAKINRMNEASQRRSYGDYA